MELGVLKTLTPRRKWNNEARDFTPWLANNIEELNKHQEVKENERFGFLRKINRCFRFGGR